MISNSRWRHFSLLLLAWIPALVWAGLGQTEQDIAQDSSRLHARRTLSTRANYTVHELLQPDGSRFRQYVAADHRVFAVDWFAMYKPNLAQLLGDAYPRYASAAQEAARQGGIQRSFRHESLDLVVYSSGHLHLFTGYAYRTSMLPLGFSPAQLGRE